MKRICNNEQNALRLMLSKVRIIETLGLSVFLICCIACEKPSVQFTSALDYDKYLSSYKALSRTNALQELGFWQSRLTKDSINLIALTKIAGVYSNLFSLDGELQNLYTSEKLIKKSLQLSARNKDDYLRLLAHNYISQHRFREAKYLLDSAYSFPDNKRATELMMFDVLMELGEYQKADGLLGKLKNNSDYNYLIRLSKWSDHKGNLDAAIRYMERVKDLANAKGEISLKVWVYTNLADYYGHSGRLEDAYQHYLMALALDPDNAYAKKEIAWIVYAHDRNTVESNRILTAAYKDYKVPDVFLLKAELAKFDKNLPEAHLQEQHFLKALEVSDYGVMYNTQLAKVLIITEPVVALGLAKSEVESRATPATYADLAYVQLMTGDKEGALETIENLVVGKSFEPKLGYICALVYKANGVLDKIPALKLELQKSAFELGPVLMRDIEKM
jgi:tetratricopeptide (TPR) repeat protein